MRWSKTHCKDMLNYFFINSNIMWYITTDVKSCIENGGLGGLGHMYYNYITSYIIGIIFDIEHVYYPFEAAGTTKHQMQTSEEVLDWDSFLGWKKGETFYKDVKNCKIVNLPLIKPFSTYTLQQLKNFFSKYNKNDRILFMIKNTNRVYVNEFYQWCEKNLVDKTLYDKLLQTIREKCIYKSNIEKGLITIHIRRGDNYKSPNKTSLNYYKKILESEILNKPFEGRFVILSLGTQKQMDQIKEYFKFLDEKYEVEYKLNYDTVKSFKLMMDCETLICGESTFAKVAGLYSDNKKYYLPLLVRNNNLLGREKEIYGDPTKWILKNI